MSGKRAAVFLDRDGTINVPPRKRYVTRWEEFRFLPGTLEALQRLSRAGWLLVVVSNQSGVERGLLSRPALREITRRMLGAIRRSGGRVQAVYYCTHHPDRGCPCRKPRAGMLRRANRRFSIDLKRSFMVGDSERDVRMAKAAGCRPLLVLTGHHTRGSARRLSAAPERIFRDLGQAARWILRRTQ